MFLPRIVCAVLILAVPLAAQEIDEAWMREHYTKTEAMVPMRDGVRLFTAIYAPKRQSEPAPILMTRTPYSCRPYGEDQFRAPVGPGPDFTLDGYIVVYQDVRGCWMSDGEFVNMTPHVPVKRTTSDIDESTDCHDTVAWLIENVPNNNGRVGMWGISYPGFYAAASMIDAHPALVASSPQAPIADWWYDDFHHHGAFFLPHGFWFLASFGQPRPEPATTRPGRQFEAWTPDGYEFFLDMGPLRNANEKYLKGEVAFWDEIIAHPNRDEFWQARDIVPHLHRVAPAVMTVGGWFDAEDLYGPLAIYRSIEEKNPEAFNILVMGPWVHGGWARSAGDRVGNVHFGQETGPFYRERIQKPFFDFYLKGEGEDSDGNGQVDLPEAYVFETGRNRWRAFDQWPPEGLRTRSLYAREGGSLSFEPPTASGPAFDEYVSDPSRPVPFTEEITLRMTREYMTDDQRFAGRRPDVVVYQTEPLEADLTVAGPVMAELWVSTSGTDSDWVVKLIDVHPGDHPDYPGIREGMRTGGYQMMVRSEVIRGRFRDDPAKPRAFVPDEPTLVRLPLQDVLHTFKAGHRVMIHVQSTWFPLVDRNPQRFVPNIYLAEEQDFTKATQRVHRSVEHATRIILGELPGS